MPSPLKFAIEYLEEPDLAFGRGATHIDPKVGIPAYGPWSVDHPNHPSVVTAGFIGTAQTVAIARQWLSRATDGVDGDQDHHPFCGYRPDGPFRSALRTDGPEAKITAHEIRELTRKGLRRREGLSRLLGVIEDRLSQLARLDSPPTVVFIILPSELTQHYWSITHSSGGVQIVRNLRAGIKARAMRAGLRTQILQPATVESNLEHHTAQRLDHPAELAWNLFVGMYFKAGGFPWAPVGIPEGTCHVGVTFYRPHGERSAMRTSVAQAFAENGDAFILRGNPFTWAGRWPHLSSDEAARLVVDVAERYTSNMKRRPRRIVVHKQSQFSPEERSGFQDALRGYDYDLISLAPSTGMRAMRHGDYPPPRGACVRVGDRHYLYTTGYIPSLGRYPHGHVPAPVQITGHVGDTSQQELMREVLLLTKMNWNSAQFAERVPVTLRFADQVGEILRELTEEREPDARYAFYM